MSTTFEPYLGSSVLPCSIFSSCLHPGAHFVGSQLSKGKKHRVEAVIQSVDFTEKALCGLLNIEHQSGGASQSTLFFDGEIISRRFPFITGKWDANVEVDANHWKELNVLTKFPDFYREGFDYSNLETADQLFMRWKEKFILPGCKNVTNDCISFSGFYYISLVKSTGVITGHYYTGSSERFHFLELNYMPKAAYSSFQFR